MKSIRVLVFCIISGHGLLVLAQNGDGSQIRGVAKIKVDTKSVQNILENTTGSEARIRIGKISNSSMDKVEMSVHVKDVKNTVSGGTGNKGIVSIGAISNSRLGVADMDIRVKGNVTNAISGGNGNVAEISIGNIEGENNRTGSNTPHTGTTPAPAITPLMADNYRPPPTNADSPRTNYKSKNDDTINKIRGAVNAADTATKLDNTGKIAKFGKALGPVGAALNTREAIKEYRRTRKNGGSYPSAIYNGLRQYAPVPTPKIDPNFDHRKVDPEEYKEERCTMTPAETC